MRALRAVLPLILLAPAAVPAQPEPAPWAEFHDERRAGWSRYFGLPGFDGAVTALTVYDGRLFAGGYFRHLDARPFRGLVQWDGTTFRAGGVTGSVAAFAHEGGDLIVAGSFALEAGGPSFSVARWDGNTFAPVGTLNVLVTDCTVWNGQIVISGSVQSGLQHTARWDGTDWHLMGPISVYHSLEVHEGQLYACKDGTVKRWNPNVQWGPAFTANGAVHDMISVGNDLIAGGAFTEIEGVAAHRLARWDGQTWSEFGGGADGPVGKLRRLTDGRILAAGEFGRVGTTTAQNLAIWDGNGWEAMGDGLEIGFAWGGLMTLDAVQYGDDVAVGGSFLEAPGDRDARNLALWNGADWRAVSNDGQGVWGTVHALLPFEHGVIGGGWFWRAGGEPIVNIAKFDGTQWRALGEGLNDRVEALAVHDGHLVAGGTFRASGSMGVSRVARWNGQAWEALGAGLPSGVLCLASYGGDLYAGGDFPGRLQRWDGSGWSTVGSGLNGAVRTLRVRNGRLFAGGDFTQTGDGQSVEHLASWNGSALEPVGDGADGSVRALAELAGELVVGGDFGAVGGQEIPRLARWDGVGWRGFDESLIPAWTTLTSRGPCEHLLSVRELTNVRDRLYVAGAELIGSESEPSVGVIRWNEDERRWSGLGGGMEGVNAFGGFGEAVMIGGSFRFVEGAVTPSWGVAAWRDPAAFESRGGALAAAATPTVGRLGATPNPFRAATRLTVPLAVAGDVRVTVHDVRGRLVAELARGPRPAGVLSSEWDGRDRSGRAVPAGVYFVRVTSPAGEASRKVLRLR